jgi:hypothetical protein
MHLLITAQAEGAAAVANRPASCGHSTTDNEHQYFQKEIENEIECE